MKTSTALVIALVVLILNIGVTLMLINSDKAKVTAAPPTSQMSAVANIRDNDITQAVKAIEPAVVSVNVTKTEIVRGYGFGFLDYFGGMPVKREVKGVGSGVIYDSQGLIITNAHVVEGASEILVVLPDKREFPAQVVGIDTTHDIAKLKIEGNNLPIAALGTSKDMIIGEWAIALGNPFAYIMSDSRPTVSVGVISALNRSFAPTEGRSYRGMIQTDAAINPGNSGGPLVNIKGQVVGINSFIYSPSGGNVGIGFAIPIDQVRAILATI